MRRITAFCIILTFFLFGVANAVVVKPASPQQTEMITKKIGDAITLLKHASIKSSRHLNSYYVGLQFVAHELEMTGIGIWLVDGNPTKPTAVYSVNAIATVFSKYPKAHRIKNPARISDHEARLILNYLGAD